MKLIKKFFVLFLALCVVICLCSCGKEVKENDTSDTPDIKVVENETGKKIIESLGTVSLADVFGDIKEITSADYTGKPEEEVTKNVKTASGLDAEVTYFTDSGENTSVSVKTDKYSVFANSLNKEDTYGISDTNIILFSDKSSAPFECSAVYYYNDGAATFDNATYVENGNYQRYFLYIDQDSQQTDEVKTIVSGETPEISDDIIKVIQSDRSFDSVSAVFENRDQWFFDGSNWYVKTKIEFTLDNVENAENFIENNKLNGKIVAEDGVIVEVENVVFAVNKDSFLEDGRLPSYITDEHDDYIYKTISLDDSGVITKLG